jgi:hypothetical protein
MAGHQWVALYNVGIPHDCAFFAGWVFFALQIKHARAGANRPQPPKQARVPQSPSSRI